MSTAEKQPTGATYDRIIRAALEEFADHGLAGARVDRIAEQAKVNKAMIYYHFKSKEQLYESVVEDHFEKATLEVHRRLDPNQELPDMLRTMAGIYSHIAADRPKIFRLLVREMANPDSKIVAKATQFIEGSGIPNMIMDKIKAERGEGGQLRDVRAKHTLASFIAMHIGYFILAPVLNAALEIKDPESFAADRAETVLDLILYGVMKR